MLTAIAIHCSSEFFNEDGFKFRLSNCSGNCMRAILVVLWCATNGLASLPFVGPHVGKVTGKVEGLLGGRAMMMMTVILAEEIFGHLATFERPHTIVFNAISKYS